MFSGSLDYDWSGEHGMVHSGGGPPNLRMRNGPGLPQILTDGNGNDTSAAHDERQRLPSHNDRFLATLRTPSSSGLDVELERLRTSRLLLLREKASRSGILGQSNGYPQSAFPFQRTSSATPTLAPPRYLRQAACPPPRHSNIELSLRAELLRRRSFLQQDLSNSAGAPTGYWQLRGNIASGHSSLVPLLRQGESFVLPRVSYHTNTTPPPLPTSRGERIRSSFSGNGFETPSVELNVAQGQLKDPPPGGLDTKTKQKTTADEDGVESLSTRACFRRGEGVPMVQPMDKTILTEYQLIVRESLNLFQVQETDVLMGNYIRRPTVGQIGLRCRYCEHCPAHRRAGGAVYFPGSVASVYQAAQNIATNHLSKSCKEIPPEVRKRMLEAKTRLKQAPRRSGGNSYWMETIRHLHLEDRADQRGVWLEETP